MLRRMDETINQRASRRKQTAKQAWFDEQKSKPCTDCKGVFPPECMDFDHVRGEKKFNVSTGGHSWAEILTEVAKCELVCANCHRIRTRKRPALRVRGRLKVATYATAR